MTRPGHTRLLRILSMYGLSGLSACDWAALFMATVIAGLIIAGLMQIPAGGIL